MNDVITSVVRYLCQDSVIVETVKVSMALKNANTGIYLSHGRTDDYIENRQNGQ
jgi:hypothetical protein